MIQRKQTLFLLLAACAMAMCFMFPIASFQAVAPSLGDRPVSGELNLVAKDVPDTQMQILNGDPIVVGQKGYGVTVWPLLALTILIEVVAVGSIFMFRKRPQQMRVVSGAFLLCLVDIFLIFIWIVDEFVSKTTAPLQCSDIHTTYGLGTWMLVVALVFLFLAQRSIKQDEEKVRAADRLR